MKCALKALIVFFIGFSFSSHAQVEKDVDGSSDFEFIGRYPGSFIRSDVYSEFERYIYPLTTNSYSDSENFKKLELEGERRVVLYDVPPSITSNVRKVFHSIVRGLEKQGFKTQLSCDGADAGCGFFFPRKIIPTHTRKKLYSGGFKDLQNFTGEEHLIYSGLLEKNGLKHYLILIAGNSKYSTHVQYAFDVLTEAELETESLVLNVNDMNANMRAQGKVTLEGIYFEKASAKLTDSSTAALKVIAEYLALHPQAKFLIVGHTDTQGSYEHNMTLSKARANSVLLTLEKDYGIARARLKSVGVSFSSPNASNVKASGRAKNRRVELVEVESF